MKLTSFRQGHVWQGTVLLPVTVEKTLTLQPSSNHLDVTYILSNGDSGELDTRFGVETNWGLAGGSDDYTYLIHGFGRYSLVEISEHDEVEDFSITSKLWGIHIDVEVERQTTLWRFPLEAISASEVGFERNYQGTTILFWWPIKLAPNQNWTMSLSFVLNHL